MSSQLMSNQPKSRIRILGATKRVLAIGTGLAVLAIVASAVIRSEIDPVKWTGQLATLWFGLECLGFAAAAIVAWLVFIAVFAETRRR